MKRLLAFLLLLSAPCAAQTVSPPPSVPVTGGDFTGIVGMSIAANQTATGSTSGTALAITTQTIHLNTVAAGTGVRLPLVDPGVTILVINKGANTLNVYPNSGAQINGGGANVAATLASGATARYTAVTSFVWFSN